MIRRWALFLSAPARRLEWFHFAASRIRSLALADSGHFDRRLHRFVSECGDLSCALGHVGESASAIVLPELQRADTDVVEHSRVELVVAARTMRKVRLQNFDALPFGRVAHGAGFFRIVEIFSAAGSAVSFRFGDLAGGH